MRTYDIEDLVADIEAFVKAYLPAEIAAVEAEAVAKGHPPTDIIPVPLDAYYRFGWTDQVLNSSVGLIITPTIIRAESVGPATQVTLEVDIAVCLSGLQNDTLANQKALRYAKALKQACENNWGKIRRGIVREKLETIGPVDLKVNGNSSEPFKAAGVLLTLVLG